MEYASDTESDTDTEARHPTFHDESPDPDAGLPAFEAVTSAVKTLCERDVPSLFEVPRFFFIFFASELLTLYRINPIFKNCPICYCTSWIVFHNI
jgi:hypothetical protein